MPQVKERGSFKLQETVYIADGYYIGKLLKIEYFNTLKNSPILSGRLVGKNLSINLPLSSIRKLSSIKSKESIKVDNMRLAAQKLLKAGNKEAALKILKMISKK